MNSDSMIGRTLGQYEVKELIGTGGMARVYRARQINLNRDVAMKVVASNVVQDPSFAARFSQETEVIAGLQHLHIVPVHEHRVTEDGIAYLTMRYLRGGSLADKIARDGKLTLDDTARILGQIAGALDYAHTQGVIHRDMKPNNILLDERENAYLADFGLARLVESDARLKKNLTETGTFMGTPAYISPEQIEVGRATPASDLYGLGVIVYEMLTGKPPFGYDSVFRLMQAHMSEIPPRPSILRPDLPAAVDPVIARALAKNPAERYTTATAFFEAFENAIQLGVDTQRLPQGNSANGGDITNVLLSDSGAAKRPTTPITGSTGSLRAVDSTTAANTTNATPVNMLINPSRGRGVLIGMGGAVVALVAGIIIASIFTQQQTANQVATGTAQQLALLALQQTTLARDATPTFPPTATFAPAPDENDRPAIGKIADIAPTTAEVDAARNKLNSDGAFIGIVSCSLETDYHASLMRGARLRATELRLPIKLEDANNDKAKQSAIFNRFMAQGAQAIFLCLLDKDTMSSSIQAAQAAGVFVSTTSEVPLGKNTLVISLTAERMGEVVGQYAAKTINSERDGKANVAILTYSQLPATVARATAMKRVFLKDAPNATIIGTYEGGLPELAEASMTKALTEHPEIDTILSINDAGSYGAIKALQAAGRAPDSVMIFSVDAESEARRLIGLREYFRASLDVDAAGTGALGIDACVRWLAGVPVPLDVRLDGLLITPENAIAATATTEVTSMEVATAQATP